MPTGSAGNISPEQGDRRFRVAPAARRLHRTLERFRARVAEHGARQHILGLGMGRYAETRHIDADDAHAVDFFRQQLQRHAGRRRHAQIDDDHRVVQSRVGQLEYRLADVLEQLARHQGLGVERHVADGAARAVEMRGEGESVHAAGGSRQHRGGAAHAKSHAQRAECRAHALRLIVRTRRVVRGVARQGLALAGGGCGAPQLLLAAMTARAVDSGRRRLARGRALEWRLPWCQTVS